MLLALKTLRRFLDCKDTRIVQRIALGCNGTKYRRCALAVVKSNISKFGFVGETALFISRRRREARDVNVRNNRIRSNCSGFKGLRTIPEMVFQPHASEATTKRNFYQRASADLSGELKGERICPAKF